MKSLIAILLIVSTTAFSQERTCFEKLELESIFEDTSYNMIKSFKNQLTEKVEDLLIDKEIDFKNLYVHFSIQGQDLNKEVVNVGTWGKLETVRSTIEIKSTNPKKEDLSNYTVYTRLIRDNEGVPSCQAVFTIEENTLEIRNITHGNALLASLPEMVFVFNY